MISPKRVLVPRFADSTNFNAQNQNAKSLIRRFTDDRARWSMIFYDAPVQEIAESPLVDLTHLLPRHLWKPHLAAWYQQPADAIFYPGPAWTDEYGLRLRRLIGRKTPLISTLEGLVGTPEREQQLTEWAGHPVFCQRVEESVLRRIDYIYKISDHVIAISPFLADMGRRLHGDKFSVHMLGVERGTFRPNVRARSMRKTVVNIASLQPRKRPELFLELADRFPQADFVWFGEGELRPSLTAEAERRKLTNLSYAGPRTPKQLAEALCSAYLFAMPSNSEGVPKATQEAATCGLPMVVYGYYETPTVIHNQNGLVAWNDTEFFCSVDALLSNESLAAAMGERSAQMSSQWDWDLLAPAWEQEILSRI